MKIVSYAATFTLGFCVCMLVFLVSFSNGSLGELEMPSGFAHTSLPYEVVSPSNYLTEKDVMIYDNMVILMIKGASISRYADSGSMRPVIDSDANGIRIVPQNESEIQVGDIVTFKSHTSLVVHRVVEKGADEGGTYFITAGDNNEYRDAKIRFSDIRYKTIAVLY